CSSDLFIFIPSEIHMKPLTVCASLSMFAVLAADQIHAEEPPLLVKKAYTFKTIGDVKIQADMYRPDDNKVRPVVVWIHGGALIMGNRNSVPRPLLDLCRTEGCAMVSFDYRLAPEVKVPEIIADIADAFRRLHGDGAKQRHLDA